MCLMRICPVCKSAKCAFVGSTVQPMCMDCWRKQRAEQVVDKPVDKPAVLHPGGVVSRDQQQQLAEMERAIIQAIADAKFAGVPQGLIVAVLHGQTTMQTNIMIGSGDD